MSLQVCPLGILHIPKTQLVSTFWVKAYKIECYVPDADKLIDVMFLMLIN